MPIVTYLDIEPVTEKKPIKVSGKNLEKPKPSVRLGLAKSVQLLTNKASTLKGSEGGTEDKSNSASAYAEAYGMDFVSESKLFSEMEMIWKRLDNSFTYPVDLAKQRVEGKAYLEFRLTKVDPK